jgi:hypothetical protein
VNYEIGSKVVVRRCKPLLTPQELVNRTGEIVKKGSSFDWIVQFSPTEFCPLNETELEVVK